MSTRRWRMPEMAGELRVEPTVALLGLVGIGLGTLCAAVGLVRGFTVPPEGNLWETATFDGAVGIFLLTLAFLAPGAGFTEGGLRRWARVLVPLALYGYTIETVQAFRGLDPRFSAVASPPDQILGGLFFLDALAIMVLFMVLAWRYVRSETTPFRLAVRYASAAAMLSFGVGIWMSLMVQGRVVGAAGNLLPLHAAGFHALQAIPLVALLFARSGADEGLARRWIHVAGLAWGGLCLAVLGQAASGLAPLAPSTWIVAALGFALVWAGSVAVAARATVRTAAVGAAGP